MSRIGPIGATLDPTDCDLTDTIATPGGQYGPEPELSPTDVVEPALARALVLAAEAGAVGSR